MVVSAAAAATPPELTVTVPSASAEPSMLTVATGVAFIVAVSALISWLAARYLIWAMAPRGFRLRVTMAGVFPVGILIGVILMLGISRGQSIVTAIAGLGRIPISGKLLMLTMLGTGLGVSWLTATRYHRRTVRGLSSDIEAFQ